MVVLAAGLDTAAGESPAGANAALSTVIVFGLPLLGCYLLTTVPLRFAIGLAGWVLVGMHLYDARQGDSMYSERSYYGVHNVVYNHAHDATLLRHGPTAHGMQKRDPALRRLPTMYFHPTEPAGQVLAVLGPSLQDAALVGLGSGTLAAYAGKGQRFTYYEIDPTVARIAEDPSLFTFLADARARGADVSVVLGDARLTIAREPDGRFDLLVIDAFSSDSIPTHLLTREALALYRAKTREGAVFLFHVSNNFLDLRHTVCNLAADAGLTCLVQDDNVESERQRLEAKFASEWVVMTDNKQVLRRLARFGDRWVPVEGQSDVRVWTDQYSNIVEVLSWSVRRTKVLER